MFAIARGINALTCASAAMFGLACLAGCSGTDVVLGDGRAEANTDGGAHLDDRPAFLSPIAIDTISTPDTVDDDPSLSADLAELYFNSKRDGGAGEEDIWRSTRSSATESWGAPEPVVELNTSDRETGIALAPDASTIWFSSNRDASSGLDIFTATRADRSDTWSDVHRVTELSSPGDDLVSAVADAGLTLLLARRDDDSDDYDLFVSTRSGTDLAWQAPAPIGELDTSDEESDAFLLSTGKGLVFTRDEDLQIATRDDPSRPFVSVQTLDELNSEADDRDAWVSADASYVVFSSNRSGSYLLYEARGASAQSQNRQSMFSPFGAGK